MKVVLHMKGGLGNQLIQYAFVRKFLAQDAASVVVDKSHYSYYGKFKFELENFPSAKVSAVETASLLVQLYLKIIYKKLSKKGLVPKSSFFLRNYVDDDFDFANLGRNKPKYLFVNGYFQHLQIFPLNPESDDIRSHLDKMSSAVKESAIYKAILHAPNPIMLHLRRGDYVTNESVRKNMGSCGIDYFKRGIEKIAKDLDKYTLFVFSDDPSFAREMFKDLTGVRFVEGDNLSPVQDFLLMRCFRYAVISNSTLSYVANMFSVFDDNIVVLPEPWFEGGQKFSLGMKNNWVYVTKA